MNQSKSMLKKVVVIGGGTGTMAVLSGLKQYADLDLTVIVSMTDDGGSNKVVRDEFGLLPLSDLRKSIIALSETDDMLLRQLFTHRFDKGNGISGHTLGNLMMVALSDIYGSEVEAIEAARTLFKVKGRVLPVTLHHTSLVAEYDTGIVVTGEHVIDEPEDPEQRIVTLSLSESAIAYEEAVEAIRHADVIIAGPGDLYTSTLANIIVDGIPQAIQASKGTYVFITNLMTKKGQTHGMTATDLVNEITRYSGRRPDVVVQHVGTFPNDVLQKYNERGEHPIEDNLKESDLYRIVRASLTHDDEIEKDKGDTLVRSLIRHDAEKLGNVLYSFLDTPLCLSKDTKTIASFE